MYPACSTLPIYTPVLHHPGYTVTHAAAADVIHVLTARRLGPGITLWAQTGLPSLGRRLPSKLLSQSCHGSSRRILREDRVS